MEKMREKFEGIADLRHLGYVEHRLGKCTGDARAPNAASCITANVVSRPPPQWGLAFAGWFGIFWQCFVDCFVLL